MTSSKNMDFPAMELGMILPRYYILDDEHNVITTNSIEEWGKFFQDPRRIVAQEMVKDCRVSTVFLGIDHNFFGEGPPLIFETMIFGLNEEYEYQTRCCTWAEAIKMHLKAVEYVKQFGGVDHEHQAGGLWGGGNSGE